MSAPKRQITPSDIRGFLGMEERAFREKYLNDVAFHAAVELAIQIISQPGAKRPYQ